MFKSGSLLLAVDLYKKYSKAKNRISARSELDLVIWKSKSTRQTIFLDVSSLAHMDHGGGIQRVQRSMIDNWCDYPPKDFDVIPIYYSESGGVFVYVTPQEIPNLRRFQNEKSGIVEMSSGDIYFNMDLNYRFIIEKSNFYFNLREHQIKVYSMIYDILPLSLPDAFPDGIHALHLNWFEHALRNSKLVCISKTVENSVAEWGNKYGLSAQTTTIKLGSDLFGRLSPHELMDQKNISKTKLNFLVVSTIEIRKCHELVLDAFEILWAEGLEVNLTFVGRKGWKVDDLLARIQLHQRLGKELFWLNNISDEDLKKMYRESTALINASIGEGFGLPLVEASLFGLPLILRDIEIFREVAGESAWYFATNDARELALSIRSWVESYSKGSIHSNTDIKVISWQDTCKQIIGIFEIDKINESRV